MLVEDGINKLSIEIGLPSSATIRKQKCLLTDWKSMMDHIMMVSIFLP